MPHLLLRGKSQYVIQKDFREVRARNLLKREWNEEPKLNSTMKNVSARRYISPWLRERICNLSTAWMSQSIR